MGWPVCWKPGRLRVLGAVASPVLPRGGLPGAWTGSVPQETRAADIHLPRVLFSPSKGKCPNAKVCYEKPIHILEINSCLELKGEGTGGKIEI